MAFQLLEGIFISAGLLLGFSNNFTVVRLLIPLLPPVSIPLCGVTLTLGGTLALFSSLGVGKCDALQFHEPFLSLATPSQLRARCCKFCGYLFSGLFRPVCPPALSSLTPMLHDAENDARYTGDDSHDGTDVCQHVWRCLYSHN